MQTEPMRKPTESFSWKVIADGSRYSAVFDGIEDSRDSAFSALLRTAREIRRAQLSENIGGLRLGAARGSAPDHLLWLPATDLDNDDADLIERIESHAALEAERAHAWRRRIDEAAAVTKPTARLTSPNSLAMHWNRLIQWARTNAPTAVQHAIAGASFDNISAARTTTGLAWPAELAEFYRLEHPNARLTPRGHFFALEEMLAIRRTLIDDWVEFLRTQAEEAPLAVRASNSEPAGSEAFAFLDAFVPLAGDDGDFYVVDTRPGPRHGCISEFLREGDSSMRWPSLADMIADLAQSFETGQPFADIWVPAVDDGSPVWNTA
jgi:cell wall assembly regulator SMI1